ncbi:hypothetical protein CHU95_05260 [Niveispirillum lacus]|uniref:Uncharacterized protein n=1 Tax=Niveispirillum lacus TaxID=1981099 RepID=A0A255Z422_9PROT|nr:hypothetical protein [Niveispirillum lacus]OYQ36199.1 hypothetical protein CHU95_05260 [Niveispirillum lacus]
MGDFFIRNEPPAPAENPYWLKSQGIDALQQRVGDHWSLYNDVDPGVTLLEHLCWALSEVAYCAGFPIEDLLAGRNAPLAVPDQFPDQTDILSNQPVSADDYGKALFDRLPGLRALQILSERDGQGHPTGRQICYLAPQPHLDDAAIAQLARSAWHYLRCWRLPGHDVLPPRWLSPRPLRLSATILLLDARDAGEIADSCALALDRLAAPLPQRGGYHTWRAQGMDGAAIINGPRLEQGWIPGVLPPLPAMVRISALARLLADVPGVQAVLSLKLLADGKEEKQVALAEHEIVSWTLDLEFQADNRHCLRYQGPSRSPGVLAMKSAHAAKGIAAGIDLSAPPPAGQFRNLADYHPVQLTLPPNWGLTGREVDRNSLQVAHARQLQGYLMPFEQLLANQFAQLANLGFLFSPRRPPPPERGDRPDDVAWQPLAQTSFSQPLYQIPDIQDLLAGQTIFDDWLGEPRREDSWQQVQLYSHNAYRHALATQTEGEHEAVVSRLAMLRHLLARHGEDTDIYDTMILTYQWYGGRERTLMIVYALWLQNLSFLAHARCCAARYPAPALLLPGDPAIPETDARFQARLLPQAGRSAQVPDAPWWQRLKAWPDFNGRPDLERIETLAALDEGSLAGISSFELRLGLFLDLPTYLGTMAAALSRALYAPGARQWLGTGSHPGARFEVPDCELFLLGTDGGVWLCEGRDRTVPAPGEALLEIRWNAPGDRVGWPDTWHMPGSGAFAAPVGTPEDERFLTCHAHILQLLWLATQRRGVLLVEPVLLVPDGQMPDMATRLRTGLFWPAWVPHLARHLPNAMETMRQRHWPAHVGLDAVGLPFARMAALIPAFVAWQNLYGQPEPDPAALAAHAQDLASKLAQARSP